MWRWGWNGLDVIADLQPEQAVYIWCYNGECIQCSAIALQKLQTVFLLNMHFVCFVSIMNMLVWQIYTCFNFSPDKAKNWNQKSFM